MSDHVMLVHGNHKQQDGDSYVGMIDINYMEQQRSSGNDGRHVLV